MRKFSVIIVAFLAVLVSAYTVTFAQEDERSGLIKYVEEQLSAPNRQIRLNGLAGSLSSNVSLDSITIADKDGIWLTIEKPQLVWARSALLTGSLEIDSLTAERIDYARNPLPDESAPAPEASAFSIPELPVTVNLGKLDVRVVAFGPTVFGLQSEASVKGRVKLEGGSLDLALAVKRLDGPGGQLDAVVAYSKDSKQLALDVQLREPKGGLVAAFAGLEGRPPVALTIKGDAPLSELAVQLAFEVDQQRILSGDLTFAEVAGEIGFNAKLEGPLSSIMPAKHRPFLGNNSRLTAKAKFLKTGGFLLEDASLASGAVRLRANAATLADGFLRALNINLQLGLGETERITIPSREGDLSLANAGLTLRYDAVRNEAWDGALSISGLEKADVSIGKVALTSSGSVSNIRDAAKRAVTFGLSGKINDITAKDPALAKALGDAIDLNGRGTWNAGSPLDLEQLTLAGKTFGVNAKGRFAEATFDGQVAIEAADLSAFSAIADRDLSGSTSLAVAGKLEPLSGGFDVTLDGSAGDLSIGDARVDPLFKGETILSGGVARTTNGLAFRTFKLANAQLQANVDGQFASVQSDMKADIVINELSTVSQQASGRLKLDINLSGKAKPFDVKASLGMIEGKLAGRPASDLALTFTGKTDGQSLAGKFAGKGRLGRDTLSLNADLDAAPDEVNVRDLIARLGKTELTGALVRQDNGLIDADLKIDSTDIGTAAALLLVEASGALNGSIRLLHGDDATQAAEAKLTARQLVFGEQHAGQADISATVTDAFGTPKVDANIKGRNVVAANIEMRTIEGIISSKGATTDFNVNAALAHHNAKVTSKGQVVQETGTTLVSLNELRLRSDVTDARLVAPAQIQIADGVTQFSKIELAVGSGSVIIKGRAGKTLDITSTIANLPLSIINAIRPDIGAAGTLAGRVKVTGTTDKPEASFDLTVQGFSLDQIAGAGLTPLTIEADGRFAGQTVTLQKATASNSQGISVSASGAVPIKGGNLNIKMTGTAPLSIVQGMLAERGTALSGQARFELSIAGSLDNPQPQGQITVENGTLVDPLSNLKLIGIDLTAQVSDNTVTINRMQARLASGGGISAGGTVGLSELLPANITVDLNNARYTDAQTFSTVISGKLLVSGNLARDPVLSGALELGKTEITVPESFAAKSSLLNVENISPSRKTAQTLDRIAKATPVPKPRNRPSILRLDVTVDAPRRIFVRGRGLDAELGGRVRLTGPIVNVTPVGQFKLRRGRLSILGQRLDLKEGTVTLAGDLDPLLNFLASTQADDVEAFIRLRGRVSDLKVEFSSSPELPEDEVLARIIFGHGLGELSPVQVVRLASIAAELTGGSRPSFIDNIRKGTGLDDIDVVQDKDGNSAVSVGKYVSDNIYLGVKAGETSEVNINLDITRNLKARGAVDSDNESSLGIFFEKDY